MHDQYCEQNLVFNTPSITFSATRLLPLSNEGGGRRTQRSPIDLGPFNDLHFVDLIYQRHGRANGKI